MEKPSPKLRGMEEEARLSWSARKALKPPMASVRMDSIEPERSLGRVLGGEGRMCR